MHGEVVDQPGFCYDKLTSTKLDLPKNSRACDSHQTPYCETFSPGTDCPWWVSTV